MGFAFVVVVAIVVVLVGFGWLIAAGLSGRAPSDLLRSTKKAKLLGPGGPDDPDANR
jgi:hypothetical protein